MMKAADTRACDNSCGRTGLRRNGSFGRRVLRQTQVTPIVVIVVEVSANEPNEVSITEDHDVFEKLATTAADPAFRHWILPRAAVSDATGFRADRLHESDDAGAEDGVAIEDQVFGRGVIGEGFAKLLGHPRCGWIEGGIEMQDMPAAVRDDEKAVENAERHSRHREEVHSHDDIFVIAQESNPSF